MNTERIGIGISTYKRLPILRKTLDAVNRFTDPRHLVVVAVDDAAAGEPGLILGGNSKLSCLVATHKDRQGIAKTKNLAIARLLETDVQHIILIEDDVRPDRSGWEDVIVETAKATNQKHLLYMPGRNRYGPIKRREGPAHLSVEWKRNTTGFVMYFEREFLEHIGPFNQGFGLYGWEHLELSERALCHQGLDPLYYPHCAQLEFGGYIVADDLDKNPLPAERGPKTSLAAKNEPLYRICQIANKRILDKVRKAAALERVQLSSGRDTAAT